jgi:hypothetical protein
LTVNGFEDRRRPSPGGTHSHAYDGEILHLNSFFGVPAQAESRLSLSLPAKRLKMNAGLRRPIIIILVMA